MIYLLDTDTLIFLVRGMRITTPRTTSQRAFHNAAMKIRARCVMRQEVGDEVGLSVITVAEMEFGARHSQNYDVEIASLNLILRPFSIFDFVDRECARSYGEIRELLERAGRPIGAMDLLIAAQARALKASLVTNNLAHFSNIPELVVENWC